MGKKLSKRSTSNVSDPIGIFIGDDSKKFANDCSKEIRTLLNRVVAFSEERGNRKVNYKISGSDAVPSITGQDYKVIPFYKTESSTYWLGVLLGVELDAKTSAHLNQVSITILRGDPLDDKEPLLRAEWLWEANLENKPYVHAQPHWHVYPNRFPNVTLTSDPSPIQSEGVVPIDFLPEQRNVQDFVSDKTIFNKPDDIVNPDWKQGAHFHYAMTAGWLAGKGVNHEGVEPTAVIRWVKSCLEYIQGQLAYIETKI